MTDQSSHPTSTDKKGFAIASLVLGVINMCSWLYPLAGGLLAAAGIILGILGLKSSRKTLALVGIALSVLGAIFTILNGLLGFGIGFFQSLQ